MILAIITSDIQKTERSKASTWKGRRARQDFQMRNLAAPAVSADTYYFYI